MAVGRGVLVDVVVGAGVSVLVGGNDVLVDVSVGAKVAVGNGVGVGVAAPVQAVSEMIKAMVIASDNVFSFG